MASIYCDPTFVLKLNLLSSLEGSCPSRRGEVCHSSSKGHAQLHDMSHSGHLYLLWHDLVTIHLFHSSAQHLEQA